ncbi:MAG: 4Fe-4S dicluster domain-containing protein [Gemmatimonadetes bacterium]|nr:4Fe-4S dicluster domain-containing protein [Gemmatimonadota bacterium]
MSPPDFSGLDPCVHCGFCLQACPTFVATGDEADSPRGRIVLMHALARDHTAAADPELRLHLDRCLGCRGCEPVCPSGVRYGPSLEAARQVLAGRRPLPLAARVVLATMADTELRRPAMAAARAVRTLAGKFAGKSRFGFAMGMLSATKPQERHNGTTALRHDGRETFDAVMPLSRDAVAVFRGCIMEGLFSHVHQATARTLAVNGYRMIDLPGQGCCGALHAHAGLHEEAKELARANVRGFAAAPAAAIAVDSAGCGATIKEYGHLLADDPLAQAADAMGRRTKDVTELLAERGPRPGVELPLRVAYDPPCHLLHAQRVAREPIKVLEAIPGLVRIPHAESEMCCGSAGIYSLLEPELSRLVLARKITALVEAGPDLIATGNPGCAMQIGAGLRAEGSRIPVVHPVELLDRSYRAAGFYDSEIDEGVARP